eukprot:1143891-Pelagomonas_calceolata.AAC.1
MWTGGRRRIKIGTVRDTKGYQGIPSGRLEEFGACVAQAGHHFTLVSLGAGDGAVGVPAACSLFSSSANQKTCENGFPDVRWYLRQGSQYLPRYCWLDWPDILKASAHSFPTMPAWAFTLSTQIGFESC